MTPAGHAAARPAGSHPQGHAFPAPEDCAACAPHHIFIKRYRRTISSPGAPRNPSVGSSYIRGCLDLNNIFLTCDRLSRLSMPAAVLEVDAAAKASIRAQGRQVTSATSRNEPRDDSRSRFRQDTVQQQRAALLTLRRFTRCCHIVNVTEAILAHAGHPFPVEPVRTLDAIHLATAGALGETPALVTIVSSDRRVRENAVALGHLVE